jgi:hypothetical protein
MLFESITDAAREFQYDYIYIDAFLLVIWTFFLIKNKKWSALKVGLLFGLCVYLIDAIWWWNAPAGPNYPTGTYIREYWINDVQIPHPLGQFFWLKMGADFMMTISYSMYAFPWIWIMFENIEKKNKNEIILYTSLFFGFWMLIPLLSMILPLNNRLVYTVRHMDILVSVWIINASIGYLILIIIYGTKRFGKYNPKIIKYILIFGCMESFFMEFPLFLWGIRSGGIHFFIYEIFLLFNQGAPYLYILWDLILPYVKKNLKRSKS